MGVYESRARLKKSMEDSELIWSQIKEVWKDEKSRQFENQFLTQLAVTIRKAESSIGNISPLLSRIQSELRE
jgi:hypothetical protein